MKTLIVALAAGLALAAVPQAGIAQARGQARGQARAVDRRDADISQTRRQEELARQRRQRLERERQIAVRGAAQRREIDRRDSRLADVIRGRNDAVRVKRNGNGPPFCRSGQGHPVHGRQWCINKGWGLGNRRDVRLDRRRNDDVIYRIPRDPRDRDDRRREGDVLERLGDIIRGRRR